MAKKDYSRRTKKDISIDDLNQDAPQSGQPEYDASSKIDIEGIIEKHSSEISILKIVTIAVSIAMLILTVVVVLSGEKPHSIVKKIIIIICMELPAMAFALMCNDLIYKMFIKRVVKSIDAIKYYKLRRRKPKVLKRALAFDVPLWSCSNKNVTEIEIGDTTITASQFGYYKSKGRNRGSVPIYEGECYAVDIQNKSIPDGIWLTYHKHSFLKESGHQCKSKHYTLYADTAEALDNCDKKEIYAIGNRIYNYIRCPFTIYFEKGVMYYIDADPHNEDFEMGAFNYDINKILRRDLGILSYRIEFAKILASA